jgi:hypothetical protein
MLKGKRPEVSLARPFQVLGLFSLQARSTRNMGDVEIGMGAPSTTLTKQRKPQRLVNPGVLRCMNPQEENI